MMQSVGNKLALGFEFMNLVSFVNNHNRLKEIKCWWVMHSSITTQESKPSMLNMLDM